MPAGFDEGAATYRCAQLGSDHSGAHADAKQWLVTIQRLGYQLVFTLAPGVLFRIKAGSRAIEQNQRIAIGKTGWCFASIEMEDGIAVPHAGQPVGDSSRAVKRSMLHKMQMHGNLAIQYCYAGERQGT